MQIVYSPVSTGEVEAPGGQEWPVKWWRSLAALGTDRRLGTSNQHWVGCFSPSPKTVTQDVSKSVFIFY